MTAVFVFLSFELCGIAIINQVIPKKTILYRLWIGLVLGLLLMMWLPALASFFMPFSILSNLIALGLACVTAVIATVLGKYKPSWQFTNKDKSDLKIVTLVAVPLTFIGIYLLHTHILRPVDGSLHVGQSTYGDLPLHLSIATSLKNKPFPPIYSIFPQERLSYPFLADSLSTSFMLFGTSLRFSMIFPAAIMMLLVFAGFMLLALRISGQKRVAVLAALLLFINGGLGFLYSLDMAGINLGSPGSNELKLGTWFERFNTILNGWYQTPANHAEFDTYNLRWSNIIVDMLVPQRTFLAGWVFIFPCIYLMYDFIKEKTYDTKQIVLLGTIGGSLPLIHTHSFLALVLLSFAWFLWDIIKHKNIKPWLIYIAVAGALSLPQLFMFTFKQSSASEHFLSLHFNWVNNSGSGLKDPYIWFYVKNIGLPFLLIIFSLFENNKKHRFIYLGAFMIFIPAEFIRFQPNIYDNNKLFYVWYALCTIAVSEYAFSLLDRLKGLKSRKAIAILSCIVFFLTGTLSITREIKSDYEMFSQEDVRLAKWVEENTEDNALFLTGTQHINPVSSLAGRSIVCGPAMWLYYHGFNIGERESDIRLFYSSPEDSKDILNKYGVDYILFTPHELAKYGADMQELAAIYPVVYNDNAIAVFKANYD
ncbi:MAG: hypothetical protein Q4E07_00510 [Eubacteriales bacterium]|nr:hypothetical protein [Eubacteriales bacterium]